MYWGNWEGHTILRLKHPLTANVARVTGQPLERLHDVVERGKQTLFTVRETVPNIVTTNLDRRTARCCEAINRTLLLSRADYLQSTA